MGTQTLSAPVTTATGDIVIALPASALPRTRATMAGTVTVAQAMAGATDAAAIAMAAEIEIATATTAATGETEATAGTASRGVAAVTVTVTVVAIVMVAVIVIATATVLTETRAATGVGLRLTAPATLATCAGAVTRGGRRGIGEATAVAVRHGQSVRVRATSHLPKVPVRVRTPPHLQARASGRQYDGRSWPRVAITCRSLARHTTRGGSGCAPACMRMHTTC